MPRKTKTQQHEVNWDRLSRLARQKFGIHRFRPGQREIIEAVLHGRDTLGIMPTGSGKSLCFQLPALVLPRTTVVVSPLLALMKDQQEELEEAGVDAARLDSTATSSERRETLEGIAGGDQKLALVTPEQLEKPDRLAHFEEGGVSLLVVDEAHCVSQWGHDFRPAYLFLRDAAEKLGRPPILALTATSTPQVTEDIVKQLGLRDAVLMQTGIRRDNLRFEVCRTVNSEAKREQLARILGEQAGTGIIYCATVRHANELCRWLKDGGQSVVRYHGQMKPKDRNASQEKFMSGEVRAVVATKAFGLGINKPDVRFVVHYDFPDSLESYYQEAGRAGRDGQPALCALLYRLEDRRIQSYFLGGKYPTAEEASSVYHLVNQAGSVHKARELAEALGSPEKKIKVVLAYLQGAGILRRTRSGFRAVNKFSSSNELTGMLEQYQDRHRTDRDRLEEMMAYGQTTQCRMQYLEQYFGEESGPECGQCDNCRARRRGELKAVPAASPELESMEERRPELGTALALQGGGTEIRADWLENVVQMSPFQPGDRVRHRRFGPGEVVENEGDRLAIRFESGGLKKVKPTYVKKIAA